MISLADILSTIEVTGEGDTVFVGRVGMTIIAETYRPNQNLVDFNGEAFSILGFRVVYVPWMGPQDIICGTQGDRPEKPTGERLRRLKAIADARRRYGE